MVNVTVELADGSSVEMRRVRLKDALSQLWCAYGEEIISMVIEQSDRKTRHDGVRNHEEATWAPNQ